MLSVSARLSSRNFDVDLTIDRGETVAVLGPNGAGKSTLVAILAGLLRPDSGRAELDGTTLFTVAGTGRAIWVPPHARAVALLAQQALLFPHMTAIDNVAFGPTSTGTSRRAARARAEHWLGEVGATELGRRTPAQLSGGQAQRIAVARALAAQPKLLLLDEPMAALDVDVAPALRRMLRRVLATQTAILITHDVLDAFALADRVAVMNNGHIIEIGATRDVFQRPTTQFTAALLGLNLFIGIRTRAGLTTADGLRLVASDDGTAASGTPVGATVAPTVIRLEAHPQQNVQQQNSEQGNSVEGVITDIEPRGDLIRVTTDRLFADVPPSHVADLDLIPGMRVWSSFPSAALHTYPLDTP